MTGEVTPEIVIARLVEHLRRSTEIYDRAKAADRRYLATATLVDIITILRTLPELKDCALLPAFKDLASFLFDLDQGKSHSWAIPRSHGGSAKFSLAQQELKMRAAVAAQVLIDSRMTGAEAFRQIAIILTRSKRKGRQDGPTDEKTGFPPATVKRWHHECRSPDRDWRGHEFFNKELLAIRSDPRWPPSSAEAVAFAKRSLTDKLMRDQFTS